MVRKTLMSLSLLLVTALAVAPVTMAQDKVEGTMDLTWNECYPGAPSLEVPDWVGTVDFDGDVYDVIFFNVRPGYPAEFVPDEGYRPFIEAWAVYDGLELAFDDECALQRLQGDLVMWGHDAGISDMATSGYAATGDVLMAVGAFEGLAGSDMAMSGTIEFTEEGAPSSAPGTFLIG